MSETKENLNQPGTEVVPDAKVNPTGLASTPDRIPGPPPDTGELPELPPDDSEDIAEIVAFASGMIDGKDGEDEEDADEADEEEDEEDADETSDETSSSSDSEDGTSSDSSDSSDSTGGTAVAVNQGAQSAPSKPAKPKTQEFLEACRLLNITVTDDDKKKAKVKGGLKQIKYEQKYNYAIGRVDDALSQLGRLPGTEKIIQDLQQRRATALAATKSGDYVKAFSTLNIDGMFSGLQVLLGAKAEKAMKKAEKAKPTETKQAEALALRIDESSLRADDRKALIDDLRVMLNTFEAAQSDGDDDVDFPAELKNIQAKFDAQVKCADDRKKNCEDLVKVAATQIAALDATVRKAAIGETQLELAALQHRLLNCQTEIAVREYDPAEAMLAVLATDIKTLEQKVATAQLPADAQDWTDLQANLPRLLVRATALQSLCADQKRLTGIKTQITGVITELKGVENSINQTPQAQQKDVIKKVKALETAIGNLEKAATATPDAAGMNKLANGLLAQLEKIGATIDSLNKKLTGQGMKADVAAKIVGDFLKQRSDIKDKVAAAAAQSDKGRNWPDVRDDIKLATALEKAVAAVNQDGYVKAVEAKAAAAAEVDALRSKIDEASETLMAIVTTDPLGAGTLTKAIDTARRLLKRGGKPEALKQAGDDLNAARATVANAAKKPLQKIAALGGELDKTLAQIEAAYQTQFAAAQKMKTEPNKSNVGKALAACRLALDTSTAKRRSNLLALMEEAKTELKLVARDLKLISTSRDFVLSSFTNIPTLCDKLQEKLDKAVHPEKYMPRAYGELTAEIKTLHDDMFRDGITKAAEVYAELQKKVADLIKESDKARDTFKDTSSGADKNPKGILIVADIIRRRLTSSNMQDYAPKYLKSVEDQITEIVARAKVTSVAVPPKRGNDFPNYGTEMKTLLALKADVEAKLASQGNDGIPNDVLAAEEAEKKKDENFQVERKKIEGLASSLKLELKLLDKTGLTKEAALLTRDIESAMGTLAGTRDVDAAKIQIGKIASRINNIRRNPAGLAISARNQLTPLEQFVKKQIVCFMNEIKSLEATISDTDLSPQDQKTCADQLTDVRLLFNPAAVSDSIQQITQTDANERTRSKERENALHEIRRMLGYFDTDFRLRELAHVPFKSDLGSIMSNLESRLFDLENNLLVSQ